LAQALDEQDLNTSLSQKSLKLGLILLGFGPLSGVAVDHFRAVDLRLTDLREPVYRDPNATCAWETMSRSVAAE
jgi:hypothetical protein